MKQSLLLISFFVSNTILWGCTTSAPVQEQIVADAFGKTPLPQRWQAGNEVGDFDEKALGFSLSPTLVAMMKEALVYNADLIAAQARLEQSRAALKGVSGSLLPQIGIGAQTGTSTLPTSTAAISGVGLIASWDLDLWGKVRADEKAVQAKVLASEFDVLFLQQSIAAQVVKSWLVISELAQQVNLSQKMVSLVNRQQDLLKLGQSVGRNTQQDLLLHESLVANYQNQLVANQQALGNAQRALEIILGRYPATQIVGSDHLPNAVATLPAGIPSQILSRRPDVLAAEQRFKATFQEVEAAKNARMPNIKITGGVGYIESSAIQLSNAISNPISSLTAQLLMPLFLGGQLEAQVEAKTANQRQSLAQYQKIALNALSEVEGSLANERMLTTRQTILQGQLDTQLKAAQLAQYQQEVGKVDLFQVLQQQLNANNVQVALLHIQNERLINRVALHQALGGHFE